MKPNNHLSRPGQLYRVCASAILVLVAAITFAQSITPPSPLQTTIIYGITASTIIDCPTYATCIDNRSQQYRRNTYHSFLATGSGTWSVQMQYADGTPTSWTSFGSSALVTNTSPVSGIGYGLGYHDFISWVITGTATISNYSASKNYWTAGVTNTFNFPITTPQGGAAGLADVVAGSPAAACTAVGSTGKMLLTATYTGLTTQTLACNISATAGGILKPASGQTITLTGSFDGDLTQHFDLSAGGTVSLASAKVTALYPQWWGATCGADDTTAWQNMLNVASANQTIKAVCTSVVVPPLVISSTSPGLWLEGKAFPSFTTAGEDSLIAKSGSSNVPMLVVYAGSTHVRNFGINCNHLASVGIMLVSANTGYFDTPQTENCKHSGANTGDGIQINSQGGTTVTLTSNVSSGATTVPISSASLQGQTFGDVSCSYIEIDYGTSVAEFVSTSGASGLTLTVGALANNHSSGATVTCLGNNNELKFFNRHAFTNDEWGLNVMHDPAHNDNNIHDASPDSFGNCAASLSAGACGGAVWDGNINATETGHYEGDKGYAIMLGDATTTSAASNTGRSTVAFVTTNPLLDVEESSGTYNVLYDVCGEESILIFKDVKAEFKPAASPNGCALFGSAIYEVGYGNHNNGSNGEWCTKNLNSGLCLNPNAGGVLEYYDPTLTTIEGSILLAASSTYMNINTSGNASQDNIASSATGRTAALCVYGLCGSYGLYSFPDLGVGIGVATDTAGRVTMNVGAPGAVKFVCVKSDGVTVGYGTSAEIGAGTCH